MFKGTLKPYQVEAVTRMVTRKQMLVAYEMGLGKTPMTIAAIEKLEVKGTVLVLCLSSLKYQWQAEIGKFSDSSSLVIDGSKTKRQDLYKEFYKYNYVIMNYEQVVNDWDLINNKMISAIVCDEATAIKGFRAKRAKKVKELAKNVSIRFALTGTPIENGRPEEIYSIMQFVDPKILGRFDIFDKTFIVRNHFGGVQRYRNLPLLNKTIQNASVRKSQTDDDVKPYLPDAVYREPLLIPLDKQSKNVYDHISQDLIRILIEAKELFGSSFSIATHYGQGWNADDPGNAIRGEVMSRITALRMLCSNPQLLVESSTNFERGAGKGSAFINALEHLDLLENLIKTPKLDAAVSYLLEHLEIDPSYKAVVFSSYLGSVQAIVDRLAEKNVSAVPYTGEMNAKTKEINKLAFQNEAHNRVLVSSDAGGYGVDLPQANLLINYDQPWSAGLSVQRNGRINRTSSKWATITIQDILVKDSIEQRQYDMLKQKNAVADAVLDGAGINSKGGVDLTVGSLISFLTNKSL
jgi:SNF2 family DNA or RNA helicase